MKRVLFNFTLFYIVGILSYVTLPQSLIGWLPAAAVLGFVLSVVVWNRLKNPAGFLFVIAAVLGIIMAIGSFGTQNSKLYALRDDTLTVTGWVSDIPEAGERFIRFPLKLTGVEGASKGIEETVLVMVYTEENLPIKAGEILTITHFTLSQPPEESNEGGFNYKNYLQSKRIYYTALVEAQNISVTKREALFSLQAAAVKQRQHLLFRIDQVFQRRGKLLASVLIGHKLGVSPKESAAFKGSGLSHVMAVSGLHVSILSMLALAMFGFFKVKKRIGEIILLLLLWCFAFLTGLSPSVVRAVIMMSVLLLSSFSSKESDNVTSIAFAALILLLHNPMAVFDVGFTLSFGATVGIVMFALPISERIKVLPKWMASVVGVTLAAQAGTLPVMAVSFNSFALYAVLGNVFVFFLLPAIYIVSLFALVFGSFLPFFSWIAEFLLDLLYFAAEAIARLPGSMIDLPSSVGYVVLVLIAGLAVWLLFKKRLSKKQKRAGGLIVLILILSIQLIAFLPSGQITVVFLNVGQGDCAVITLPDKTVIMIDTGPEEGITGGMTRREVIPYLAKKGISELALLVLSHYHEDHSSGVEELLRNVRIRGIIGPLAETESRLEEKVKQHAQQVAVPLLEVGEGDQMEMGKVTLTILSPGKDEIITNENNSSIVLRIDYGNSSFLFTGDIEALRERQLLKSGLDLDTDVLKVAHHGSNSSTTKEFIEAATPDISVISVGKNTYSHPDNHVISRLKAAGSKVYRTDLNKTITIKAKKNGAMKVSLQRTE